MIDRRTVERWIAWVRLGGVAFAILQVAAFSPASPPGYQSAAWALTGAFAGGALGFFWLSRVVPANRLAPVGLAALAFDTAVIAAYAVIYSYEYGNQTRWAVVLVLVEAALRYGLPGGVVMSGVLVPYFWFDEWWRAEHFGPPGFISGRVSFPAGVMLLTGLIVGWLVERLDTEARVSSERAAEAEALRDALGRRADMLEAANRCARALGSSLDVEQAFGAFIR
jgi:hypothetical protein